MKLLSSCVALAGADPCDYSVFEGFESGVLYPFSSSVDDGGEGWKVSTSAELDGDYGVHVDTLGQGDAYLISRLYDLDVNQSEFHFAFRMAFPEDTMCRNSLTLYVVVDNETVTDYETDLPYHENKEWCNLPNRWFLVTVNLTSYLPAHVQFQWKAKLTTPVTGMIRMDNIGISGTGVPPLLDCPTEIEFNSSRMIDAFERINVNRSSCNIAHYTQRPSRDSRLDSSSPTIYIQVEDVVGRSSRCFIDTVVASVCGNGLEESDEQCDDGNDIEGDGCFNCNIEWGFGCRSSNPSVCFHFEESDPLEDFDIEMRGQGKSWQVITHEGSEVAFVENSDEVGTSTLITPIFELSEATVIARFRMKLDIQKGEGACFDGFFFGVELEDGTKEKLTTSVPYSLISNQNGSLTPLEMAWCPMSVGDSGLSSDEWYDVHADISQYFPGNLSLFWTLSTDESDKVAGVYLDHIGVSTVDLSPPIVICPVGFDLSDGVIPNLIDEANATEVGCLEVERMTQDPTPGSAALGGVNFVVISAFDSAGNVGHCHVPLVWGVETEESDVEASSDVETLTVTDNDFSEAFSLLPSFGCLLGMMYIQLVL